MKIKIMKIKINFIFILYFYKENSFNQLGLKRDSNHIF